MKSLLTSKDNVAAIILPVDGTGMALWSKVDDLSCVSGVDEIGSVSVYATISSSAPPTSQFGGSAELLLVPRYDLQDTPSSVEAIRDAVCAAWLWGPAPAGTPFTAQPSFSDLDLGFIMAHSGIPAVRWELWARSGQTRADVNQVYLSTKMVGRLGQGAPLGERVSRQCIAVPQYGSAYFPDPTPQPSETALNCAPPKKGVAITPSDTTDLTPIAPIGITVGGSGTLVARYAGDLATSVSLPVQAGQFVYGQFSRVMAATTATNLIGWSP